MTSDPQAHVARSERSVVSDARPKLLDRPRGGMLTRHYSGRTEDAYAMWINPETKELFSDNTGAAKFTLKDGGSIINFCKILLDGRDYGQPLSMKSVLVTGAPESDWTKIVREFGAPQAMSFGKVFMW